MWGVCRGNCHGHGVEGRDEGVGMRRGGVYRYIWTWASVTTNNLSPSPFYHRYSWGVTKQVGLRPASEKKLTPT